MNFSELSYEF
jgi:hypothetical protein